MFRQPVDPCVCPHPDNLFVRSTQHIDGQGSYKDRIGICPDCGSITIMGEVNGQAFGMEIQLITEAQVLAAGQYLRLLNSDGDEAEVSKD